MAFRSLAKEFTRAVTQLVDESEKFDESTYNKRLERLKSQFGEEAIDAESVIQTVRNTSAVIRESNGFLSKLYNAENNNLWYKPIESDEIYTTMKPDYRQMLKKRYGEKLKEIR